MADMYIPLIPEEMFMWIKCENRNEKPTTLLFLSKKVNTKSQLNKKNISTCRQAFSLTQPVSCSEKCSSTHFSICCFIEVRS